MSDTDSQYKPSVALEKCQRIATQVANQGQARFKTPMKTSAAGASVFKNVKPLMVGMG